MCVSAIRLPTDCRLSAGSQTAVDAGGRLWTQYLSLSDPEVVAAEPRNEGS